ncbi:RHS repeat domain-containing protein [Pseudidiomarina salilacus]|uniref:RHS repeat domain-containing protein n=1 Tax=Pseudidiomarina salilacus TaxID=3384452 RepID=UPI003985631B
MLVCCFNRDTFDADSNQLTGHRVGASGSYASIWSYDSAGNQLQKETNTWTYGGDNRVRRLTRSSGFYYENWYDTNGQRVAKSSTTTDWHFLYGQSGELLSETKNGPHVKSYIWLEGELVALVYNDDLYFVHNDHLGRPHKVTDDTKAVVWEADLQSFDRSVVSSSIGALNIGFPGQYWDNESGTWQNWHRDYDPSAGRYIQSDPIGLNGGLNTYAYVDSNPLLYSDPDGLSRKKMVGVVCLGMSVGAFAFDAAGVRTAAMNAYENNPYAHGVEMLSQGMDELVSEAESCNEVERKAKLLLKLEELRTLRRKLVNKQADWTTANSFGGASGTLGVFMVVAVGTCGSLLR